ncbi:MAG TPA: metal ABC transporter permease [Anaerolineales bacterium]|nr:metal ABC transporter permease [Anaerolineales bacterium]
MDLSQLLSDLFFDYTLRTVALGAAILGIVSGMLGSFAVLRKQSLLGDAISHAALPGIVLAFLITRQREPAVLMFGALTAGWLATLFMLAITRTTHLKNDTSLGLVLSVFFGFGLMLLTFTQRLADATQAGLDKFLFGQAATLLQRDVITMGIIGMVALGLLMAFWKEFKIITFDPEFAASLGFPVRVLDVLLTTLLVIAIVIGLQTVGVVLMSAMIVAPAAAARQWTDKLSVMILLGGLFGALAGVSGTLISSSAERLPTGPIIVLCISAIVVFSMLFATNRGLIWNWFRSRQNRRTLRARAVLSDLNTLALQHPDHEHGHSVAVLRAMSVNPDGVSYALQQLQERGQAREVSRDVWTLTNAGLAQANQNLKNETE